MTATDILNILNGCYRGNPKYLINNLYVFNWESDYLAMTQSGYWYEVEVKISRADFFADFKKKEKHLILSGEKERLRPNYFAYCVPKGLITADEVPEYAGLYSVEHKGQSYCTCEKPMLKLHKDKIDVKRLGLTDKFYYNYRNLLNYRNEQQEREKELRYKITRIKEEFKAVAGYDFSETL